MKTYTSLLILSLFILFSCGGDDDVAQNELKINSCFSSVIDGGIVEFNPECSEGASSWLWDFGDGLLSESENPSHEYQEPGEYRVKLTVSNANGSQDTSSSLILIEEVCISCSCVNTASSFDKCGTKQQMESECDVCVLIPNCTCGALDTITGNLEDGFYIRGTASSENPQENYKLGPGYVDNPTFGQNSTPSTQRPGMYEGYYYLNTGSINFSEIEENRELANWGGTETTGNQDGYIYRVGLLSEGGAPVNISEAGLYHVVVDVNTASFYVNKINTWNIIGPAAEGWSTDVPLNQKSADNGVVVFEATNVTMNVDEFKLRYNSNWILDRKNENPGDFELVIHTNWGGPGDRDISPKPNELSGFIPGGVNFLFAGEGRAKYTVTMTFNPGEGFEKTSINFTKTGEAGGVSFDPGDYNWGVIGSATAGGWNIDYDMKYSGEDNGTHSWHGMVYLADSSFKIRANDAWDIQLNANNLSFTGNASSYISGSDNFDIFNPGTLDYYYIKISTSDEGLSFQGEIDEGVWGIIGGASPAGWDASTPLNYNGNGEFSASMNLTADEFKFRANDEWWINLGGSLNNLVLDGGNLTQSSSGNFTVTLSTNDNGLSWSASVQ